jgi:hypothetical protein
MLYRLLADLTVLVHFAFIVFVVGGALLVVRWPRLVAVHLPCAVYGAWIEFTGHICPLTPLENHFRRLAGASGYEGGFIEHYIIPVVYPAGLTPRVQILLGVLVVVVNLILYAWVVTRWRRSRRRVVSGSTHLDVS